MRSLFPYQKAQSAAVLRAFAEGKRRVVDQMPTGAGKTPEGAHTARILAAGEPALWITHRDELIDQGAGELRKQGASVAIVRPDEPDPGRVDFLVCSIQTLHRRGLRPRGSVVVLDEARHYLAPEWGSVIQYYADARIIGLDATPALPDGGPLGFFDHLVQGPQVSELLAIKRLVPARHIAPDEYGPPAATAAESYLRDAPGTSAILYVDTVATAEKEAATLRAARVGAEAISERTKDRADALQRFRDGISAVFVNVFLLGEGVDLPSAETIGIYRGCQSVTAYRQMLGRGGRTSPGKRFFTVLDACGLCRLPQFGWYDDHLDFSVSGEAGIRRREEPGIPEPMQCQGRREDGSLCLAWVRPPRCPVCGSEARGRPRKQRTQHRPMGEVARAANAERDERAREEGRAGIIERWVQEKRAELLKLDGLARKKAISRLAFKAQATTGGDLGELHRRAWRALKGEVRVV
jgi:superfamily II DNA or RNA helicase